MGPARTAGRARKPAFVPRLTALEGRTLLATLVVDPAGGTGIFTTIQAAVNAANSTGGDTIQIHPATYTEQVTIGKSLTMMGTAPGVVIQPPSTLTPDPVLNLAALVEINNAATVNMSDLTISGPGPTQAPFLTDGILVVAGATANVTGTTVTLIQTPSVLGDQIGNAIQVGGTRSNLEPATATLTNDIISSYQKTGILVRGGSTATITGNTISGIGPTTAVAQNGIQVDLGARATITGNTITGNEFNGTGGGPDPTGDNQSTGVLIDNVPPVIPGGTITVSNNTIGGTAAGAGNDIGISSSDPEITVEISGNTLQGNRFEGILLHAGTTTVSSNTISGSNLGVAVVPASGDTVDSTANLTGNQITNNGQVSGLSFPGAGILLFNPTGATTKAVGNLVSNNIANNGSASVSSPGILLQTSSSTTPLLTANFNRIVGNSVGLNNGTNTPADAPLNWWGSNTGPNTAGSDKVSGVVSFDPWLVLSIAASPGTIGPGGLTSSVTASVTTDSSGTPHPTAPFFPDGIPIAFGATGGTIAPASVPTLSGKASSSFTSTTPGARTASATLDNQTVTIEASADLAVTKVADPTVGTAGQALTYTLTVTNAGPFLSTGVIATDAVPAGAAFVAAAASQGTASLVNGVVVASLGDLAVGASATVTIVVTPSAAGSLTNTADVAANEPDPDPSNNSFTMTTAINPAPPLPAVDLAVTKSAPTSGVAGQDLDYTIVVTNAGPGNESAARLLDQLPPGVVLVSSSVPPTSAAAGLLVFDLGDLPAHASRTIVLIVQPTAAGTLVNQAVVSGIQPDLDPSNNVASATTTVSAVPAALAVAVVADPSTATVGRELTYTLTVGNFGPGPASGVVLTSALPAGVTIVAASQTQGSSLISNGVVTTALGDLAVGASATVTIVVIPTAAGPLTTVASVAGNEPNPNPAGAVAMVSTPVAPEPPTPMADLVVTKSASPIPATVGVPLSYTVTVTNLGPDAEPAAGVTLVDLLPPGVVFVSSSLPPTSTTPNGLTYALGTLAAGASQSVTIVVMPTVPGTLFNQAVATGVGPDPNPSNNLAEVSVAVHQAPTVVSLERLGYHAGPTTLVLSFSAPLDAATAVDLRNYQLFQVLKGGHREAIRIRSATYDPSSRTVTLAPAHPLYLFGHYQLVVNGTSPTGVSDVFGNLLDGAGTGRPGSNYVRLFGSEVLVGQSPPAGPKAHAAAPKAHAAAPKAHAAAHAARGHHPARASVAAHPAKAIAGRRG
jgi:uncharacterized repeat protein (TIGR01451 family)